MNNSGSPDHMEKDRDAYRSVLGNEEPATTDRRAPKNKNILITVLKLVSLVALLYFFICSLDFLSSAFRLIGGREAGRLISNSELLKNPVVGLMIGVLVTVLVQSSSTSTSIVVTMVGSKLIEVRNAIPIVMGANIGTSVTNTIVSLMQSTDRNEFRRAFAAATVHDMFNWLTVIVLLPVEVCTGYLEKVTNELMSLGVWKQEKGANKEFLTRLTKPFTGLIVQLDKKVLDKIATGNETGSEQILKICCKYSGSGPNRTCVTKCESLFAKLDMNDSLSGIVLLIISLVVLCTCLIIMVKVLHSMLRGPIALIIKKTINKDYAFPYSVLVNYATILIGCILTILVQSSSIFTSALTPLAGIGVISLERMYPLTLGSNIGTTTTGILAALAAVDLHDTLQIAFCHLLFNVTGILLFYPIPFMRFPIPLAQMLGNITAKYRWFSVFYLVMMFFLLPFIVFGLSMAGTWVFACIGGPLFVLFFVVILINLIQRKRASLLPLVLQNWEFLPLWMHSLDPIDSVITKLSEKVSCLACCVQDSSRHNSNPIGQRTFESQLHILGSIKNSNSDAQLKAHVYDNDGYIIQMNGINSNSNSNTNGINSNSNTNTNANSVISDKMNGKEVTNL